MPADRGGGSAVALAGALGLVHAVSLSVPGLWWLQLAVFTGLCVLLRTSTWTRATVSERTAIRRWASTGFAFGFTGFLAGIGWLFISMHRYGEMPAPLAASALILFCGYLAMFPALACGLSATTRNSSSFIRTAILASSFTLTELLRGSLFTGFPWLSPGYAHADGPFSSIAPWLGVYGVGLFATALAAVIAEAILRASAGGKGMWGLAGTAVTIVVIAASAGAVRWVTPQPTALRVDLAQGNVPQDLKFNPQRALAAMHAYIAALQPGRADLVVLPETAWTLPWSQTPPALAAQLRQALGEETVAAVGMPLPSQSDPRLFTNSIGVVDGRGMLIARYDKRHLVPFGEFIPAGFGWFVAMMKIPLGEFSRGSENQPLLRVAGSSVAFNICYEDLFGGELAEQVRSGANILVNASNIAWFGDSHAQAQHLEISRMRALEFARPMLRATNTGVTAAIDHQGRVVSQLPGYREGVLSLTITPTAGLTPYARTGDKLIWLLVLAMLALGWLSHRRVAR
jgi:apolipoprotein N-acyltransferase